ncbi:tectonic-1 [Pelodytes ibericus]
MAPLPRWFMVHLVCWMSSCVAESPGKSSYKDVVDFEELEDAALSLLNDTDVWEGTEHDDTSTHYTSAAPAFTTTETPVHISHPWPSHTDPPGVFVVTQAPTNERDPGSPVQSRAVTLPSPVTNVASLCVCDLLVDQCDVNCCCDPLCTASDFSVFSGCSVPVVKGDGQLCTQETILYSINSSSTVPQRVIQRVETISPDVFCIQATNYQPALSFITPDVPTESNFDSLLKEFGAVSFNMEDNTMNSVGSEGARSALRYEYGSPILTSNSFLKLPAPLGSNACTDNNPIGFLISQDFKCSRNIEIANCSTAALTLGTYTNIGILTVPNSENVVDITVKSITLKSLDGTFTPGVPGDFIPAYDDANQICSFVVLSGNYMVTYTEQGAITNVTASFTLGTINNSMIPLQQNFQIRFTQNEVAPSLLSGNPGYVVGLPLVAGYKLPQSGIIQSTNRFGQLTLLQSSVNQNCLTEEGNRASVLFGFNMVSGCLLRLPYSATQLCQLTNDVVLNALKGQQFPEYVASFGNSQPQNVLDWIPITIISPTEQENIQNMCKIPVSLELEVRWTKYGSLVNPQAKIVNVTQKITHTFIPTAFSKSEKLLQILTSVIFVDVSASAEPGYKAQPTIDAKLPFGFFHPFV